MLLQMQGVNRISHVVVHELQLCKAFAVNSLKDRNIECQFLAIILSPDKAVYGVVCLAGLAVSIRVAICLILLLQNA